MSSRIRVHAPVATLLPAFVVAALAFAGPAGAAPLWYKGIGNDGKQAGERGVPDFTWTANCFATASYNSLYWFFLNGHPTMVPGNTSFTADINNLWTNYMNQPNCGANHGSMFTGLRTWMNEHAPDPGWRGTYRGLQDSAGSIDSKWLRRAEFGYPTWEFYRSELKKSEDVILLVDWVGADGTRVGHAITGAGVGDTDDKKLWIGVSDPSDEAANTPHELDPTAWTEYQLQKHADGYLFIDNYPVAGGADARVYGMFAVSPIPEPAVSVLMVCGYLALSTLRRRSRHVMAPAAPRRTAAVNE